ncbi:MAG: nuclear transport factor 2 family protein [Inhella sp.]
MRQIKRRLAEAVGQLGAQATADGSRPAVCRTGFALHPRPPEDPAKPVRTGDTLPTPTHREPDLKTPRTLAALSLCGLATACALNPPSPTLQAPETPGPLFEQVAKLDAEVFSAFNTCAEPGQLARHAQYFSESVEFFHDNGGVTWNRSAMLANTQKHVCGHFRRELVPGSLRVYPIKDYGAIATGVHRFCQFKSAACEGAAEFVIVWHQKQGRWQITRVLSFGHRAI